MLELKHKFIAQNQYGETVYIKKYPRKELLAHTGYKSTNKMCIDVNGASQHIGYVIGGVWWDIMRISTWH